MDQIPFVDLKTQYSRLKEDINQRIQGVLDHGMYIMGPEVEEFEKELTTFTGTHSLSCSSGTDALILALMAADIGPGDEVITTAFSFIATAETILLVGAKPVFVDIDPISYNIDPGKIEEAITSKTKAIMPVSLYGQVADMEQINEIASSKNLVVIEDAAQSFGAMYQGRRSCNVSTLACTSFFPAKPLGCYGDGGAVFTQSDEMLEKLKLIRNHGQESRYYHTAIGVNGRLDSIQCAILSAKLEIYQDEINERQKLAAAYTEALKSVDGMVTPTLSDDRDSVWAQYTLRVPDRKGFQARMGELNVPTAVHYPRTMADQPAYTDKSRSLDISVSRKAAEEVVSLPMHPYMTEEHKQRVIDAVRKSV